MRMDVKIKQKKTKENKSILQDPFYVYFLTTFAKTRTASPLSHTFFKTAPKAINRSLPGEHLGLCYKMAEQLDSTWISMLFNKKRGKGLGAITIYRLWFACHGCSERERERNECLTGHRHLSPYVCVYNNAGEEWITPTRWSLITMDDVCTHICTTH